jgi:hypothetical protein
MCLSAFLGLFKAHAPVIGARQCMFAVMCFVPYEAVCQFALVEAPSTSLDELTWDCLSFVMQQLHQRVEHLVSRHCVQQCFVVA